MIEDHDSDDEGDQRGSAEGEPPEPTSASGSEWSSDIGAMPFISVDQEPRVDVGGDVLDWLVARLVEAIPVARSPKETSRVGRLSVRILGDDSMSEAHQRWCSVDGPTDVLTFHTVEPDGLHIDLMICVDEARRRAAELGHDQRRELLLYALHGLLHCLGHDDHDAEAYALMHDEEDRVLRQIGVGPVFRPEEAS